MAGAELKGAVIGLGFVGAGDQVSGDAIGQRVEGLDGTHAQALAGNPHVRLVAGSSRDHGRRSRFQERLGVGNTYADWRQMLSAERPDIVCVATNTPLHAAITEGCAEAGVHAVLCEKPIATRLSDADRMVRICHEHGTLLVINHNRRWQPLWIAVRDEIRSGTIGAIAHASAQWPTGRLGNVGTHMFDALHMLLDARATAVSGFLDPDVLPDCRGPQYRDPGGWGTVWFGQRIKAFIDAPQAARFPMVLRVVGSRGCIEVRRNSAVVEIWDDSARRALPVTADGRTSVDRAVGEIVACLISGGVPSHTAEDGVAALETVIGFSVSDRSHGQLIPLPIRAADRELEVMIG